MSLRQGSGATDLGGRFAAFGLADLLVPATAVLAAEETPDGGFAVKLAGGDRFAAWCAARPAAVRAGRKAVDFEWDPATRLLLAAPPASARTLAVSF